MEWTHSPHTVYTQLERTRVTLTHVIGIFFKKKKKYVTTNCFLCEHIFLFFFKTHLLAAFNIHSEYLSVYSSTEMVAFLFN